MSSSPARRPVGTAVSLVCFALAAVVIPVAGFTITANGVRDLPNDGQNYGVVILPVVGFLLTAAAMAVAGLVGAAAAGVGLWRRERPGGMARAGLVTNGLILAGLGVLAAGIAYLVY